MTNDSLASIQPALNIDDHSNYTNKTVSSLLTNNVKTPKSHTIMIPSPTVIPIFSGKCSESPNQFLIRVQEHAATVYGWDQPTLLFGISQFLQDTELDWYCHLRDSNRCPQNWAGFVSLFLFQFNPLIRIARQEQKWYECKQWENETINEFLIRLRAVWSEQKPDEMELDFKKHLLCKMRSDLFNMMSVSPGASLDEIILEAQQVEQILYHRNEEQCLTQYFKEISFENSTLDAHKHYNDNHINHYKSTQLSNLEHSSNEGNISHQQNKYDTNKQWNNDKLSQDTNINFQFTTDNRSLKKSNSIQCRSCEIFGHFSKSCLSNSADYFQSSTLNHHSKNEYRALGKRDVGAHP